jgi:hypothetical protein
VPTHKRNRLEKTRKLKLAETGEVLTYCRSEAVKIEGTTSVWFVFGFRNLRNIGGMAESSRGLPPLDLASFRFDTSSGTGEFIGHAQSCFA